MITPRLYRKAVLGALQWRLFLLWWAALVVPGAIAALPVIEFLRKQLDHSPLAAGLVARLDGGVAIELARQLGQNGAGDSIALGFAGAALVVLFTSPFVAGATLAAARSDEPLPLSRLLTGAGEYYGRMLRTSIAALVPLGIGGALAAAALKAADKANQHVTTEAAADRNTHLALAAGALAVFLAHLVVDAARAQFAADPGRRSGVVAHWSALKLLVRRPLRSLGLGLIAVGLGPALALVLMELRLEIAQSNAAEMALAWALAQAAHVAIGWGRSARLFGLADLSRADTADRDRAGKAFAMAEPATSPPPALVQSSTLDALDPPRNTAPR
ncbi:MAG TPA: hypothetical protein VLW85_07755 [Myxococcales bacterium]|nr:hypothetical protein [Myxococcales bacterium]